VSRYNERSDKTLDDLARMFNATIRGWSNYYGCYYNVSAHTH
jgi:RNA-directed DNA polymerase